MTHEEETDNFLGVPDWDSATDEEVEEWNEWISEDEEDRACCPNCGKPYEDFSDLGCGYCDRRSPEWGIMP